MIDAAALGFKTCLGCKATACNETSKTVLFPNGQDYCRACQDEMMIGTPRDVLDTIPRYPYENSCATKNTYTMREKVYLVRDEKLLGVERPSEIMLTQGMRAKIHDKIWKSQFHTLGKVFVTDGQRVWRWFDLCYSCNSFQTWAGFMDKEKTWELIQED